MGRLPAGGGGSGDGGSGDGGSGDPLDLVVFLDQDRLLVGTREDTDAGEPRWLCVRLCARPSWNLVAAGQTAGQPPNGRGLLWQIRVPFGHHSVG